MYLDPTRQRHSVEPSYDVVPLGACPEGYKLKDRHGIQFSFSEHLSHGCEIQIVYKLS